MTPRVAWSCVRIGIAHRFAYRVEVLAALVSALLVVLLSASIWGAVFDDAVSIGGLDRARMSTYVIVAWVVRTVATSRLEENLGNRFRSGQIAADLCKPLDLQLYLTLRDTGRALASVVLTAVPVAVLASLFFPFLLPSRPETWAFTAVSVVLAIGVGTQIAFLVGVASFWLKNIAGLTRLERTVVAVLSGAVVPLDALPDPLRSVVSWLPFQCVAHLPTRVFLEGVDAVWQPLAIQAVWLVVLGVLCRVAWVVALDRFTVQGG